MKKQTIGLFGTCGRSKWRDRFVKEYARLGVSYYNPVKANWKPEDAADEAEHLADDAIILFPITKETYATGSLAEVGFSILQAIRLDDRRDFVILIESVLDDDLMTDPNLSKESLRARALVKQHLKKLNLPNVYVVNTLDEMLAVSLVLYKALELTLPLSRFNPQNSK